MRTQAEAEPRLLALHDALAHVDALAARFGAYQFAYARLLLELGRRAQFAAAAHKVVRGMRAQLAAMADGAPPPFLPSHIADGELAEERAVREAFTAEHGAHLPDDLCPAVEHAPPRWAVVPAPWAPERGPEHPPEAVPEVDADLLADARERVAGGDGGLLASLASI
jgi:autophagy-related protein 17